MSKEITRAESKHWQSHNNNPEILIMWERKNNTEMKSLLKQKKFQWKPGREISYDYQICIIHVYNIKYIQKQSGIFSDLKNHTQTYVHIHTHICTQSRKNTLKQKSYIPINKENHLLKIHPLIAFDKGNSRYIMATEAGEWLRKGTYRGGNNISEEVKCKDPTDWSLSS